MSVPRTFGTEGEDPFAGDAGATPIRAVGQSEWATAHPTPPSHPPPKRPRSPSPDSRPVRVQTPARTKRRGSISGSDEEDETPTNDPTPSRFLVITRAANEINVVTVILLAVIAALAFHNARLSGQVAQLLRENEVLADTAYGMISNGLGDCAKSLPTADLCPGHVTPHITRTILTESTACRNGQTAIQQTVSYSCYGGRKCPNIHIVETEQHIDCVGVESSYDIVTVQ